MTCLAAVEVVDGEVTFAEEEEREGGGGGGGGGGEMIPKVWQVNRISYWYAIYYTAVSDSSLW